MYIYISDVSKYTVLVLCMLRGLLNMVKHGHPMSMYQRSTRPFLGRLSDRSVAGGSRPAFFWKWGIADIAWPLEWENDGKMMGK